MTETNERERRSIRRLMRERRRHLDTPCMGVASDQLRHRLLALPRFRHVRNLAAYLAIDGEISLAPLIEDAWFLKIPVYLPCLRGDRMVFRRYESDTRLRANRFGIPEPLPRRGATISARYLDTVLAPLVAFDDDGGRLGTGGGFYDRTFAFLRDRNYWKHPTLIGVAYEFQHVPALPLAAWDIPLSAVVTDTATRIF